MDCLAAIYSSPVGVARVNAYGMGRDLCEYRTTAPLEKIVVPPLEFLYAITRERKGLVPVALDLERGVHAGKMARVAALIRIVKLWTRRGVCSGSESWIGSTCGGDS